MFKCECGQEFDNPQKFNGHKSHCTKHHLVKYGNLDKYYYTKERNKEGLKKANSKFVSNTRSKRLIEIQRWLDEKHTCKACGKIMNEKFGSGEFCSRSCANKRQHSVETKEKIKNSLKLCYKDNRRYCLACGKEIGKKSKTGFCHVCLYSTTEGRKHVKTTPGGYRKGSGRGKQGYYKGYWCDSSWELAYVIYNIDHNIKFSRNHDKFKYIYNNKVYMYYPDFIVDNAYIEIKGYWVGKWEAKLNQFPKDLNLIVLYKNDIKPYIDYCINKYGKNFIDLYDHK